MTKKVYIYICVKVAEPRALSSCCTFPKLEHVHVHINSLHSETTLKAFSKHDLW